MRCTDDSVPNNYFPADVKQEVGDAIEQENILVVLFVNALKDKNGDMGNIIMIVEDWWCLFGRTE